MTTGQVDKEYEVCEGYPSYFSIHPQTGERVALNSAFGYPSEMLNTAMARDDVKGFAFYFERYFNKDCEVNSNYSVTLVQHAKERGANKCAAWLKKKGCQ